MTPQTIQKLIAAGIILFILAILGSQSTHIVEPGHRGVRVTLGKVSDLFVPEGLAIKLPLITQIHQVNIQQQTQELETDCYTSDLQQVFAKLRVLYRIPETSVVQLWRNYQSDDPRTPAYFHNLIRPRIVEALKETTATESAELIVQNRESIKTRTLQTTRQKLGQTNQNIDLITIVDIALQDTRLSPELTAAIEQKTAQKIEADKANFVQQQTQIEAQTAVIKAKGEAESIRIRGQALRQNPTFIDLQIVEKWDGNSPLAISAHNTNNNNPQIIIPIDTLNTPPNNQP